MKGRDNFGLQRVDGKKTKLVLNRVCEAFVSFNQAVTHSLVLLKMGKIISRNMLS